jgi:hypothetical protein
MELSMMASGSWEELLEKENSCMLREKYTKGIGCMTELKDTAYTLTLTTPSM